MSAEHIAEKDTPTWRRRLLRALRKTVCGNGDAIWGHLCEPGEGCQR